MHSTVKSDVHALVGRTDSSGADDNAAEDGWKWVGWGWVRDKSGTRWSSISPLSSLGKLLLLDDSNPVSGEVNSKSSSSVSRFLVFYSCVLCISCKSFLCCLFRVVASLCQEGFRSARTAHVLTATEVLAWVDAIERKEKILYERAWNTKIKSHAGDLQPFRSSWKIPHWVLHFARWESMVVSWMLCCHMSLLPLRVHQRLFRS